MSDDYQWYIVHAEGIWMISPIAKHETDKMRVIGDSTYTLQITYEKAIEIMRSCKCIVEWWSDNRSRKISAYTIDILSSSQSIVIGHIKSDKVTDSKSMSLATTTQVAVCRQEQNIDIPNKDGYVLTHIKDILCERRKHILSCNIHNSITLSEDCVMLMYRSIQTLMQDGYIKNVIYNVTDAYKKIRVDKKCSSMISYEYDIIRIPIYEVEDNDILYETEYIGGINSIVNVIRQLGSRDKWVGMI